MRPLTFDPYVPLALWAALALGAGALLIWYAWASRRRLSGWRRRAVLGLMTLVLVLPLALLLNPTWLERIPPPAGKPLLTVLVDRSASMATADAGSGKTRFEAAADLAAAIAGRLGERYDVRLRTFAAASAPVSAEEIRRQAPDGETTDVARALEDALEEDRPQGQALLLLSDGIHNAGGGAARLLESAAKARALAAPIYVKPVGGQGSVQDLAVELELGQELAFVGQKLPVVVGLRQRGALARRTQLSLLLDGKAMQQREVELKPDGRAEAVLELPASTPGVYRYEVRADALPNEVTPLNNSAALLVRVVDRPIRVLLLEGKPYWDGKFLIRTLSADPSIELVSLVQMTAGRLLQRKIGRAAPATDKTDRPRSDEWTIEQDAAKILASPDGLDSYQVLILGRAAEVFLSDQALGRIKKWIAEGEGSLVCFRGAPAAAINQRLGELMPVRFVPSAESRFRVQWTSAGQAMRWLPPGTGGIEDLSVLPSLARATRPEQPAPLAVVVAAEAGAAEQPQPAITYQPLGSGRVVVIEGAGMWRWAFLPPAHQKYDDVYGLLWRSLIRWLVSNVGLLPHQQLALRADQVTFDSRESVAATLLLRPGALGGKTPPVELTGTGMSKPRRLVPEPSGSDPGQFRVVFGRLPEGRYTARVTEAGDDPVATTLAFDVRGNLSERLDLRAQPELMGQLARRSGGEVLGDDDPTKLAVQFDRHLARTRPERIARNMAWDRWWTLGAVIVLCGAAWGLRRHSGLV